MSKIEITEEKFNALLKQNEELINKLSGKKNSVKRKKNDDTLVRLKKLDGKLIIDKETSLNKGVNKEGDEVLFVKITLQGEDGKTTQKKISCLDIVQGKEIVAKVIKKIVTEEVKEYGSTARIVHGDWKSTDTGEEVDSEVVIPTTRFLVKLPDGKEIEVGENVINI